jgi:hypothetical protein
VKARIYRDFEADKFGCEQVDSYIAVVADELRNNKSGNDPLASHAELVERAFAGKGKPRGLRRARDQGRSSRRKRSPNRTQPARGATDRPGAADYESGGREFESLRARQKAL